MNLRSRIIDWIRKQVQDSKAKGIVIGLSGGIDSALTAVLCKEAVGDKLLGLILPCLSKQNDEIDALCFASKYNIMTSTVNLDTIYNNFINKLPHGNKLSMMNIKPRLRMITLYYYANLMNYIVCGTGNKSELVLGYFTKYGDGGADIMPIADLLKTQVRKLAKEIGIHENIIKKAPSAGLWEGQTDEEELGITYSELDKTLLKITKGKKTQTNKSKNIMSTIERSRHKTLPPRIFKI